MDKTFEEAAKRIAECSSGELPTLPLEWLIRDLRNMWQDASHGQVWIFVYAIAERNARATPEEVADLVIRKQHDYGHDNILAFGMPGVVVRVSDKWARSENLTRRGTNPLNESLRDSWLDMAGYALVAMMLEEGVFTLPLEQDLCGKTTS